MQLDDIIKKQHEVFDPNSLEKADLKSKIIKQINASYLLATSDMETLENIFENINIKVLEPGDTLLSMGWKAQAIYMVFRGNLTFQGMDDSGMMVDRFSYQAGDIIGELWMDPENDDYCMGIVRAVANQNLAAGEKDQIVLFELKLKKMDEEYLSLLKKKMTITEELMENFSLTKVLEKEEKMILMNKIQMETFNEGDFIIKEVNFPPIFFSIFPQFYHNFSQNFKNLTPK